MEFESYRPVITGLIGGLIAMWLTSRWAKTLPQRFAGKANDQLLREHRWTVRLANALFLVGLGGITVQADTASRRDLIPVFCAHVRFHLQRMQMQNPGSPYPGYGISS